MLPSAAFGRVHGRISPTPMAISMTPVMSTQNVGSPRTTGTIGSNQAVLVKCCTPTLMYIPPNAIDARARSKANVRICISPKAHAI